MDKNYNDIINTKWPIEGKINRTKMPLSDRAKIFLPFAALKGYEEAIEKKQRIIVPKSELSDDMKDRLDMRIQIICSQLEVNIHPMITIVYFEKDKEEENGVYLKLTGMVSKLDTNSRIIQIVNKKISLDNIFDMESDIFNSMEWKYEFSQIIHTFLQV